MSGNAKQRRIFRRRCGRYARASASRWAIIEETRAGRDAVLSNACDSFFDALARRLLPFAKKLVEPTGVDA